MTEKPYKKLLKTLGIGTNKSNTEAKELLEAKLSEYLDRTDAEAEQKVSDIQDALDYVEDLIEKMGGGIALAPAKGDSSQEISEELLKRGAKRAEKRAGVSTYETGSYSRAVTANSPKGKPWFYSLTGDEKVDGMFELAEKDLQSKDFFHAASVFDMILRIEVTNAGAYLGKVLANYALAEPKDIATCYSKDLDSDNNLRRASDCGNEKQKQYIKDVMEERRKSKMYLDAEHVLKQGTDKASLQKAAVMFGSLGAYRDAEARTDWCNKEIKKIKDAEEQKRKSEREKAKRRRRIIIGSISACAAIVVAGGLIYYCRYMTSTYYGTSVYPGAEKNYKEYKIADSVKEIAPGIFQNTSIESITIPDSVEVIGDEAFAGCENLTEAVFEDGLTSIGNNTFSGCTSLTEIELPKSVVTIGEGAFEDCKALTKASFPEGLSTIGNKAFSGCESLTEVILSKNLTAIGDESFFNCKSLTEVVLPDGLTTIGEAAFSQCYGLENIVWNGSLQKIGARAFELSNIKSLEGAPLEVIQDANYSTEENPFVSCRNLIISEEEAEVVDADGLYRKAAPDVNLLENEQQFLNLIAGKTILGTVTLNPYAGQLKDIEFEENGKDRAEFSFEYQKDGYFYNVTGYADRQSTKEGEPSIVQCEFSNVRTFYDKEVLLTTDSEGVYTNLMPMLANKSLEQGDTSISLINREIQNLEVVSVDEQTEGEDKSITVGVKGKVTGGFTTYSFEGALKVVSTSGGVTSEFTTMSLSDSGISFLGVYSDGGEEVKITGQLGDYLYLGNNQFIDTVANCESGFYYFDYGQYSCHRKDVSVDYDNGIINIEGRQLKKIGELETGDSISSGYTGIWKGSMLDRGIPYTAYCFDKGDGTAVAVMEWAYNTAKGTPRYGTYVSTWIPDSESGKIKMNHGMFYEVEDGYHERTFYGTLSGDGNSIVTSSGTLVRQ